MLERRFFRILTGVFILGSLGGFAWSRPLGPAARGSIYGTGTVSVNNEPALPGTTLLPGDVVATGKDSTALIQLSSGIAIAVNEDTEVALSPGTVPGTLNLRQGGVVIRTAGQQTARVSVLGASVFVQGQGDFPGISSITSVGGTASVFAERGHVEIHGTGAPTILLPGKYVKLEAGAPQVPGQRAGRVFAIIPSANVKRLGKGPETLVKLSDQVNWEDVLRTLQAGRVRVELLDGSFLNIGARSVMRITKHDPASQQTSVELTLGRLRGEVGKITKPQGSFEVKTPTAVIGVVGTDFFVLATARATRVSCLQGSLAVRNINPAIIGTVTVHAGQATSILRGAPPVTPTSFSPAQFQNEISQTSTLGAPTAPGGPQQPGQAAGGQPPGPPGAAPGAAPAGAAGAGGGAGAAATTAAVVASTAASTAAAVTSSLAPASPSKP